MNSNKLTSCILLVCSLSRYKQLSLVILLVGFLITDGYADVDWTAYNDCVGSTISNPNATEFTDYQYYSSSTSGLLKNDATGSTAAMPTVTFTITTILDQQPQMQPEYGSVPEPGTDAYDVFNGKIDFSGSIIQHSKSTGWFVEIKFTNLDPSKEYTFVGSAFRNKEYTDRISQCTIQGADTFTNNSSDDVLLENEAVTQFLAADNSNEGHVVRWDGIDPGSDGTFSIHTVSADSDGRQGYPLHGFMLQQIDDNTNAPPIVDAGGDKDIYLVDGSAQVAIDASVIDDDLVTMKWEQISGPDLVTFLPNDSVEDVSLKLPTSGQYVFQLQAWDGLSQSNSSQLKINVYKPLAVVCPIGDLNDDCYVDMDDLSIFVTQWLDETCFDLGCGDFASDDGVDLHDFSVISKNWNTLSESTLVISEFMSVNSYIPFINSLNIYTKYDWKTNENIYCDWIELYNNGSEVIDLAGWYLTDDPDEKVKWQFPSDMSSEVLLEPGDFLIVFASNKESSLFADNFPYVDYYGALHTNFELGSSGEYLALVKPDGLTVAYAYDDYPEQYPFISYGISKHGTIGYLINPTPGGMVNYRWSGGVNSLSYPGKVADTKFSHNRGFYESAFSVTITCDTAGSEIYYTLDGTEPKSSVGGNTFLYSGAVNISTTTCLRAKAFKDDLLASNVDTQTYLFLNDVVRQVKPIDSRYVTSWGGYPADYEMEKNVTDIKFIAGNFGYSIAQAKAIIKTALESIPTLSVSTDPDNLFGSTNGIYTHTNSSGSVWERPVSAEYFGSDPNDTFQIDCGLRLQGGASRNPPNEPKHSLSLRFKGGYGDAKLKTNIFKQTLIDEFDSLQLRSTYNNSWTHWSPIQRASGTMIRDQFARDCLIAMGQQSAGAGTFVHLYLNGLYWGVYNMHERQEASHYAAYYGGDGDYYDATNAKEIIDGDADQLVNMRMTVSDSNPSSQTDWEAINTVLDVENYIDWTIVEHYANNRDLKDSGNWRSAGGGIFAAPWQYYSWDSERTLEDGLVRNPSTNDNVLPFLLGPLRGFEEFRIQFADRLYKHLRNQGALTYASAWGRFNARATELDKAIIAESARWGDYRRDIHVRGDAYLYTKKDFWLPEISRINGYLQAKETNAITHFQGYSPSLYPSIEPPVFQVNSVEQSGGLVPIPCTFNMNNNGPGDVYYTLDGTDPREYWTGNVSGTAILSNGMPIELDMSVTVKSRVKEGSTWSAVHEATYVDENISSSLRITELMYHPADPNTEYIELTNIGTEAINLNQVTFTRGVSYTFPSVSLAPNEYVIVAEDFAKFETTYDTTSMKIAGQYSGSLDNGGEKIELRDAASNVIQMFGYKDSWYDITDGGGFSLTIKNATFIDINLWDEKSSWRPSAAVNGSPGIDDSGVIPEIGAIVINEILAHTDLFPNDWIELYNTTGTRVNIGGWFLSDSDVDQYKYEIDANTWIEGGDYLVFTQDSHFGSRFALSEIGEKVYLRSPIGTGYIEQESFGASENNVAFGRYYKASTDSFNFVSMSLSTPGPDYKGAPNAYPKVGPIVINEIMYHPIDPDAEYIELKNITGSSVTLYNSDSAVLEPWKMTEGVEYSFPTGTPVTIPAGGYYLLIKDLATFTAHYGAPTGGKYAVWADGSLSNGGEKIEISMPGDLDGLERQYIRVDRVTYSDGSHPVGDDLWPTSADGEGMSLSRKVSSDYGNDVVNWQAATPTPGS